MKAKLITALRTSARAIELGTIRYDWRERKSCNCGVLFCALTGLTPATLDARLPDITEGDWTWQHTVAEYCPITGLAEDTLLREVMQHGLSAEDIVHLENLSDERVVARMKQQSNLFAPMIQKRLFRAPVTTFPQVERDKAEHVAAYMRAWADILTEEGADDVPDKYQQPKTKIPSVSTGAKASIPRPIGNWSGLAVDDDTFTGKFAK